MHGRQYGYANDDIFFLESCLYSQVCTNGDGLFALGVGEHWTCQFSEGAFRELQQLLLAPPLQSIFAQSVWPASSRGSSPGQGRG